MDNMNNQQQNYGTNNFQQQNQGNMGYNNQNGFNGQYENQMNTPNQMGYNYQMNYNNQIQMNGQNQGNNKTATILCIVSLICCYAPYLILELFTLLSVGVIDGSETVYTICGVISGILQVVHIIGIIASIVLIIVVRVKYPTHTFGKIVMWIYIVQFVVFLIFTVVTIIACGIAFGTFLDYIQGCGEIG